jgi:trk system potassium uptake protein TrkA
MTMKRQLTVAVIGLGNFGLHAARALSKLGHIVIAVDQNEDKVQSIGSQLTKAVEADVSKKEVLKAIGVGGADLAVVSLGNRIDLSALATLHLKELGVKEIWVKVISDDHAELLLLIGATETIFPERDMAERMARRLSQPNIVERVNLAEDFGILEIRLPEEWRGKSLVELDVRKKFGINVIAIKDDTGRKSILNPDPKEPLAKGDILYVIGLLDDLEALQVALAEKKVV